MLGVKTNNNVIFVNENHKPSRHLVDLIWLSRVKAEEKKKGANFFHNIFKRQETKNINSSQFQAGFNIGKYFQPKYSSEYKSPSPPLLKGVIPPAPFAKGGDHARTPLLNGALKSWHDKYFHKVERLAFFPLVKFLFLAVYKFLKIFYKLSYGSGWLAVFITRFIFLFVYRIITFVFHLLTFFRFKPALRLKLPHLSAKINRPGLISNGGTNAPRFISDHQDKTRDSKKIIRGSKNNLFKFIKSAASLVFLFGIINKIIKHRREKTDYDNNIQNERIGKRFSLKPAIVFSAIMLALILPVKAYLEYKDLYNLRERVTGISQAAVNEIMTASQSAQNFDFSQASQDLDNASANFAKAKTEIANISVILNVLAKVIPNSDIKMAANADLVLEAGRLSVDIGNKLMLALEKIPDGRQNDVKIFFDNLYVNVKSAAEDASRLQSVIVKIDESDLPQKYQDKFIALKSRSTVIAGSLNEVADLLDTARLFLGFEADKRYLLIFQNNAEMRGSGGFVGSFALIDFSNGKIKNIEVPAGGSYDTEGGLLKRIIAPEPLQIVNPLWHFWDANWWPDWPASAGKLAWFYEKSGGPTVDGVISLTPTVMENLLGLIGPVDMTEKYGVILDKDNFWQETQSITEERYKLIEKESEAADLDASANAGGQVEGRINASTSLDASKNQPKKIIGDLLDKIISELPKRLSKDIGLGLIRLLENSLSEKQILFYFYDQRLEAKVKSAGWDGSIKATAKDYLLVVNTNIAGGKSDRKIMEKIEQTSQVERDGTIYNTVFVKRTHTGIKREKFTGVRNVDWMRIYVPEGSVLLEAQGFLKPDEKYFEKPDPSWENDPDLAAEKNALIDKPTGTKIYQENGKTVFANWSMVDPGETVTVYLKYKLPFKIQSVPAAADFSSKITEFFNAGQKDLIPYSLLAQKQPGSFGSQFASKLILPAEFKIVWTYPAELSAEANGWDIADSLITDKFWAVLIEPRN